MAALTATIPQQSIPNNGTPTVVITQSFAAINAVNVLAGQSIGAATLQTDATPSTYPASGIIMVNVTDQAGNGSQVQVVYTGHSGKSFTGCTPSTSGVVLTTSLGPASPQMTGQVVLNRTGTAGLPWLNTLTSATSFDVAVESSADGGATWQGEAASTTVGGVLTDRHGATVLTDTLQVGPINPAANQVRMVCTVHAGSPSPVEISGTATVTTL